MMLNKPYTQLQQDAAQPGLVLSDPWHNLDRSAFLYQALVKHSFESMSPHCQAE